MGEGNAIGSKRKIVGKVKTIVPGSHPAADKSNDDDDIAEE
jgi:hypothetical protein